MELADPAAIFERYPHQLSGGQRQRVVIAAALVAAPELILLDEPTTALDKTVESQVLDLVSGLQKQTNTTLVYVSHDLNVVARMCERVLVMKDGKVVEEGRTREVFADPQTAYARMLIGAIPKLESGARRTPARPQAPQVLTIDRLQFSYADRRSSNPIARWFSKPAGPATLSDISLSIRSGTTLGVVGESGSGKSTLASIVAGSLVETNSAAIVFDGKDPASSLNPQHSVEQIVGRPLQIFFGMTRAACRERVVELLEELDLNASYLRRLPRQLSGGQQQRVAIARAFACKPDLILCDEVTSALDVSVQAQVLKLMRRLQREHGTAYLFISHDLPVVAQMSDQILVLENGCVRDYADTETILKTPQSAYTRKLLSAFARVSLAATQTRSPEHVH
jgi:peptide/nickel transport system ATP-binding protein